MTRKKKSTPEEIQYQLAHQKQAKVKKYQQEYRNDHKKEKSAYDHEYYKKNK